MTGFSYFVAVSVAYRLSSKSVDGDTVAADCAIAGEMAVLAVAVADRAAADEIEIHVAAVDDAGDGHDENESESVDAVYYL